MWILEGRADFGGEGLLFWFCRIFIFFFKVGTMLAVRVRAIPSVSVSFLLNYRQTFYKKKTYQAINQVVLPRTLRTYISFSLFFGQNEVSTFVVSLQ